MELDLSIYIKHLDEGGPKYRPWKQADRITANILGDHKNQICAMLASHASIRKDIAIELCKANPDVFKDIKLFKLLIVLVREERKKFNLTKVKETERDILDQSLYSNL
jgi:hypothetical protein